MSMNDINRRDFLKIMGWGGAGAALAGCDVPSTVTLEEGKEEVVSYLIPEEYVIPGVGVWYASTCAQCAAGCGIQGRVREGRLLKVEGHPESPINAGKLCQMGQAGLQGLYNPDRLTKPMMRVGGALKEVSWDQALDALKQKTGAASGLKGDRFAWVTGTVSGHQSVLIGSYLEALGSRNHHVYEVINDAVSQAVNRDTLGEPSPHYRMDNARMILSFGADFLGTWNSPVHFATQYGKFRSAASRGVLVQVEPKMTLTGANADLWVAARPGTEGVLALGIANTLIAKHKVDAGRIPASIRDTIAKYDIDRVSKVTGVSGDRIIKISAWLKEKTPSLVLAGASAEGQTHGYEAAAAAMLLNILLGNVGQTIVSSSFPFPQIQARPGNSRDLLAFADAVEKGQYDAVFFYGTNPVYTAPAALKLSESLAKVPFKVAFAHYPDETAMQADLVLPLHTVYEDWGTTVASYQAEDAVIGVQQPLMEPVYDSTRGFGDLLLALLKMRSPEKYSRFDDYYAYLRNAVAVMPASVKPKGLNEEEFWNQTLQKGMIPVANAKRPLKAVAAAINVPDYAEDADYPYHLVPSARLGLWDGRHANLPWLQEAPDQITKAVWASWAELHPSTAAKLGVKEGDFISVTSAQGTIEAQVYIYKGIHPDAVAVPMGQGHEAYGRYAKGLGVNPLKILNPVKEARTGELALHATRVKLAKTGRSETFVKMGGSETQVGRKLVATVRAEVVRRTEGGGNDVA